MGGTSAPYRLLRLWKLLHASASACATGVITLRHYRMCLDSCSAALAQICKRCSEHFEEQRAGLASVSRETVEASMYEFHVATRRSATAESPSLAEVNQRARAHVQTLVDDLPLSALLCAMAKHMSGTTGFPTVAPLAEHERASAVALAMATAQLAVAKSLTDSIDRLRHS